MKILCAFKYDWYAELGCVSGCIFSGSSPLGIKTKFQTYQGRETPRSAG